MLAQHRTQTTQRSLTTRLCLRCGHDGDELQPDAPWPVYVCPCCGEDLYARPAKSYAELELIADPAKTAHSPRRLLGALWHCPRALARRIARLVHAPAG